MTTSDHDRKNLLFAILALGALNACASSDAPSEEGGAPSLKFQSRDLAQCSASPNPPTTGVALLDVNENSVSLATPNTSYYIRVSGSAVGYCLTFTNGAEHAPGQTHRCVDASNGIGDFFVETTGSGGCVTGFVTAIDGCGAEQAQNKSDFSFAGGSGCSSTYVCGYAQQGNNCNNWRTSRSVSAADMNGAVSACQAMTPSGYSDRCYILHPSGGSQADIDQCGADGGSWRPANNCCNFKGTLSCGNGSVSTPECQDGQAINCTRLDGTSSYKVCYNGHWGTCI